MNGPSRRQVLAAAAGATLLSARCTADEQPAARCAMGVTIASYWVRFGAARPSADRFPKWADALDVLEHCASLGAGGLQVGVKGWATDFARKLRDRREALGLYLEGQVSLPAGEGDVGRFEADVGAAKEAGATILRAAIGNRRYEEFDSADAYGRFAAAARRSLELAEPIARRQRMMIAVENHKDFRVPELLDLLKHLSSEHVGVTLDTGNSIALLEDPMGVIEALAPHTLTVHFKDMSAAECADGFLLSEVPLGEGFLDLRKVVNVCRRGTPAARLNLEMITRDPLRVPCLTEKYWATFAAVPGQDLARTLAMVRERAPKAPLPRVNQRPVGEVLEEEERNVQRCFAYAREKLGL